MKRPASLVNSVDRTLIRDIGFLMIAAWFVLTNLFGYDWSMAAMLSPVMTLALCVALYLFIQISWVLMVTFDKLLMRLNNGRHI